MATLRKRAEKGDTAITKIITMSSEEAAAYSATNSLGRGKREHGNKREVTVGNLQGLDYFRGDTLHIELTGLIKGLEDLQAMASEDILGMPQSWVNYWAKRAATLPSELEKAFKITQAGRRFFTKQNLRQLESLDIDMSPLRFLFENIPE